MAVRTELSQSEARRIALAAQGFDRPRPSGPVRARHLREVIRRLGLLQIDFVNVLVPAHYVVPFSRLGPFDRRLLDEVVYRGGEFTEQWAHEASIVPLESWPLLAHRRATHRVRPYPFESFLERRPDYVETVLAQVERRGPLSAADLPGPEGHDRRLAGSWIGTVPRAVLEALFGRGRLAVVERRSNFARVFDLAERVIPAPHFEREVGREDAQRELLLRAARAHGVATARDLADYYRMPVAQARPRLAELVEAGALVPVRVESWREPALLHPEARLPRRIAAAALLSPFDPVVWTRQRVARLFEFDYRIEIFVPEPQRRWGYYVLPFLLGDRLVARVDLRAERPRRLVVRAAHLEPGAAAAPVASALAEELRTMAAWLGLEAVRVERRGDFARRLAAALAG
ncbi:MAG TPA: crosslink repair DNA glycosylase YcaQ family protein [Thermoanaerobaculia bacterium]|nr:crosslink repair DNA glycosylase YcaQ family protein [Thermoanaerobaculia bacterium]